jgi:hypothetical protein
MVAAWFTAKEQTRLHLPKLDQLQVQDSNLESCEQCSKSETLKALQHGSATTTWAKTQLL